MVKTNQIGRLDWVLTFLNAHCLRLVDEFEIGSEGAIRGVHVYVDGLIDEDGGVALETASERDLLDGPVARWEQIERRAVQHDEQIAHRVDNEADEVGRGERVRIAEWQRVRDRIGRQVDEVGEYLDGQNDERGEQIETIVEHGRAERLLKHVRIVADGERDERVGDACANVGAHNNWNWALHARYDAGADEYDGDGARRRGVLH